MIGVVLALGFLLLLVALQAPVIALVGVLTNLLATAAAFGVARLIFQNGDGASLLGFQSQGFLDAWGPVFFFAMIFAIAMDYTVFLLASAKEHHDRTGDPHEAMVGGVAHSGRVILAAAAVMVAVFFTFALSGPLPPKEMGVILGVAVLLDALLVRLILIPVALRLLGPWAWWLPRWADRLLPDVTVRPFLNLRHTYPNESEARHHEAHSQHGKHRPLGTRADHRPGRHHRRRPDRRRQHPRHRPDRRRRDHARHRRRWDVPALHRARHRHPSEAAAPFMAADQAGRWRLTQAPPQCRDAIALGSS